VIFTKTKMCKFHILNQCSRGDKCQFAHHKEQMQHLPDLFRTKLCRMLINTGNCENAECRYAHSQEELRVVPGFSGNGPDGEEAAVDYERSAHQVPPAPPPSHMGAPKHGSRAPQGFDTGAMVYQEQNLDVQFAMLQMGQAAQAHAMEAMRLQSMALNLQVGTALGTAPGAGGLLPMGPSMAALPQGAVGGACPYPAGPLPVGMTMPGGGVMMGMPTMLGGTFQGPPTAAANGYAAAGNGGNRRQPAAGRNQGREASGVGVRKTSSVSEDSDAIASSLRRIRTASCNSLVHMAAKEGWREANEEEELPQAYDIPTKVNICSLKSMSSSGSLPIDMLQDHDPLPGDMVGGKHEFSVSREADENGGWRVKNTFLDFDTGQGTPMLNRLRPICSAAGRLDALAEASDSPRTEKRSQDTPMTLGQGRLSRNSSFQRGHISRNSSFQLEEVPEAPIKPKAALGGEALEGALKKWAGPQLDGSAKVSVKNTFLDFGPEEPRAALRSVHTHGGRLCDLLGQE